MKKIINMVALLAMTMMLFSCDRNGDDWESEEQSQEKKLKLYTQWGADADEITSAMGRVEVAESTDDALIFHDKKTDVTYSYKMSDESGCYLLAVFFPGEDTFEADKIEFDGYTYIGNLSDAALFANAKENTVCARYFMAIDDEQYVVYGFTPLESSEFAPVDPIVFTLDEARKVTKNTATLSGSVSGMTNSATVYLTCDTTEDFSSGASISKSVKTKSTFSFNLSGLKQNTTYYYQTYVSVDGIRYVSGISSFTTADK